MVDAFSHPFAYWVGMDTDPRTTPEALAEFNRFYSTTHVHEVIAAHPGFVGVSRYELLDPDPRGGQHRGPRWLAVYELADEAAAQQYVKDSTDRPWLHRRHYSPWPPARRRAKIVWRLLWQRIAADGTADQPAADAVFLVGLNEPEALAQTDGVARRFELYRAFAHPDPGCPRFCAIAAADQPASAAADAVWRLGYRRIPPPD